VKSALYTFAAIAAFSAAQAQAADQLVLSVDYDNPTYFAPGVTGVGNVVGTFESTVNPVGGWAGKFYRTSTTDTFEATLSGLGAHTGVSVKGIIAFLDSWDSTNGSPAPDELKFFFDDVLVATLTYNNASGSVKAIDGATLISEYGQFDTNNFYSDTLIDISTANFATFAHTGSTLKIGIQAGGAGWQGGTDEAWGIDAWSVTLTGVGTPAVPESSTWAMMIAGFGAVGFAMRRRRSATVRFA